MLQLRSMPRFGFGSEMDLRKHFPSSSLAFSRHVDVNIKAIVELDFKYMPPATLQ